MNTNPILFAVETPLDFVVSLSENRWQLIVTQKHPVLAGQEELIKLTLEDPDEIRRSKSDERVYLFYRTTGTKRWTCVVVKHQDSEESFLITAYPTDAIKEGDILWTR
ncbi:hypothetical protein CLV58_1147 [Spirosoma oryzae]|uniref:DUF4258 domain-containing protein n=1 Tax=Spirosoma oryzae TaxID=1469603 RepID=A0A2T0SPY4_9BACT|nr:hypothetical protein [Spirosoma oryzae]PRY35423.1 hypothetical protein CLV58_1147 [Spirosoma oryzae]